MAFNPTKQQQNAIDAAGNVLVSAAAGSGKTAVLVERVIRLITDKINPVSADRLLIVTFTNAAAAEMRSRIEKRLDDECRANPDNIGLLKQKQLISGAKICTIDSFCIDLVRENFVAAGISPDFKISDQNSLRSIDEAVLAEILETYYNANDPVFFDLMELVGAEYDDGNFLEYLLKMYNYSRQMAFPTDWFKSLSGLYEPENFKPGNLWYDYSVEKARKTALLLQKAVINQLDILSGDEKAYKKFGLCFETAAEKISELLEAAENADWDGIFKVLEGFELPNTARSSGETEKFAKLTKDYIIDTATKLKKLFYTDCGFIKKQFAMIYRPAKLLSEILVEFEKRLFEEYNERNTFTFHNIEHLALKLLCSKNGENIVINEQAQEIACRFDEVMVDEYQDTNNLQDILFYVLSDHGKKLFAVGDVKQSIYGFRGAQPSNFLRKINSAVPFESAAEGDSKKIILGSNFRSKPEICDYINFFFENMMTAETGGIVYDKEEKLIPEAVYPHCDLSPVRLDILEEPAETTEKVRTQARRIAQVIKQIMSAGKCIRQDNDTLRSAEFSDFAVLLRNTSKRAPVIAEELRKNGVPANFNEDGYAESFEVSVLLSLLKVIDNPDSDVELLSVLHSPIFGFTSDELADIRINRRKGSLYSAVTFAAENGNEHCRDILKALEKYRILAATLTLPKLITYLLYETGFLNTVSALNDGDRRRGNLLMLSGYAEQFAGESRSGIGGFVRYIINQSQNGLKSAAVQSGSDTVKIMTIHSSKGLQFPVCIVALNETPFSDNDIRNAALYSDEYGIGFKYFDEQAKEKYTTVGREVIVDYTRRKTSEEELRLLYVAMTRAEDMLYFTACAKDPEKEIGNCISSLRLSDGNPAENFYGLRSYLKWLITTSLVHPDGREIRGAGTGLIVSDTESRIVINVIAKNSTEESAETSQTEAHSDPALEEQLEKNIGYIYPYADILETEAKSSVSELANKAESEKYAFKSRPSFMSEGGLTAAEKGTATHKIIEFIDFNKTDELDAEIERLYEWQFITEREAEAVNRDKFKAFFDSELFGRIKKSPLVKREMRFLTELPAYKVNPKLKDNHGDEKIIVQGAVDLCFEENGNIIVVDFKTDRTDSPQALAEAYGEQLSVYAQACAKIFEKPVKEKIIYSFSLSQAISV